MTVIVLGVGAVLAASMNLRCVDAAREAARLAARGDETMAVATARRVAPGGASIAVHTDGEYRVAVVTARVPLFPLLRIRAEAVAATEPSDE